MRRNLPRTVSWLAAAGLIVYALLLAPHGHYSADAGVKMIQAHDLWKQRFESRSLLHDRTLDPTNRYYRTGIGFERKIAGSKGPRQGTYSIAFVAPAAVLGGVFGFAGTFLLPLAGALLALFALRRLLAHLGVDERIAAATLLFLAFVTPMLFYTAQLFEHTLAVGLVTGAMALLVRDAGGLGVRPALAAGALAGAAAMVRPEVYCAIASLGLATLLETGPLRRKVARAGALALGALVVLAGYWALNLATADTWDPLVTLNKKTPSFKSSFQMLWGEVPKGVRWTFLIPIGVALAAALVPPRLRVGRRRLIIHLGVVVICAWAAFQTQIHSNARILTGMFAVTPLALYGALRGPWDPRTRTLWVFAVTFVLQVLILDRGGNGGGLQLGARLLLPALPALLALTAKVIEDDLRELGGRRARLALGGGIAALVLLSLTGQIAGLRSGNRIARAGAVATDKAIAAPGKLIVAPTDWQVGVLSPALYHGKDILITRDDDNSPLFKRLASLGHESFIYIGGEPIEETLLTDGGQLRRLAPVEIWKGPRNLLTMQVVAITPFEHGP